LLVLPFAKKDIDRDSHSNILLHDIHDFYPFLRIAFPQTLSIEGEDFGFPEPAWAREKRAARLNNILDFDLVGPGSVARAAV